MLRLQLIEHSELGRVMSGFSTPPLHKLAQLVSRFESVIYDEKPGATVVKLFAAFHPALNFFDFAGVEVDFMTSDLNSLHERLFPGASAQPTFNDNRKRWQRLYHRVTIIHIMSA